MKVNDGIVKFSIDPEVLKNAEEILEAEGLSRDEFIEMIYENVIMNQGINIPFMLND